MSDSVKRRSSILSWISILLFASVQTGWTKPELAKQSLDRYMIVVTGSELLRGAYADSHTHFLTGTLKGLGIQCVGSVTVGDRAKDLRGALEYAATRANLTIVTGGLGPTDDDITRGVVSEYSGIPLRVTPEVLAGLEQRYANRGGKLPPNVRRQALTPSRGAYLPNPNGTAVGLVFEAKDKVIVSLPGPPRELRPLVANELLPYLGRRFGLQVTHSSTTLRFVGIGESSIQKVIDSELEVPADVEISSSFQAGRVDITFFLPGSSQAVLARLGLLERELRTRLDEYIYSDDGSSLEKRIVSLLESRGGKLILVEVGTGGAIANQLSTVDGLDGVLAGGLVGSGHREVVHLLGDDRVAAFGVGGETSLEALGRALARDASKAVDSEWALVVTHGVTQSGGSRPLWITAGSRSDGYVSKRTLLTGKERSKRERIVTQALDLLRRRLEH